MFKKLSFFQGVFLTASIFVLAVSVFRNHSLIYDALLTQKLDEWLYFGVFAFSSLFLLVTLYKEISERFIETKKGIKYIAITFFFVFITTYLVFRYQGDTDYQTSLALFVSSSLLGAGWWIQATINSAAARKSHTINTVMTQRYSELFFKRSDNFLQHFPVGKSIHMELVEAAFSSNDKKYKTSNFPVELLDSAKDLNYVMNFYEFVAVGVLNGDFDEKLIRECYEGIILGLEKRGYYLIQYMRKSQGPKVFCSLISLIDKWTDNNSLNTKYKNGIYNLELGELSPVQEDIDKMLQGTYIKSSLG
ncbi:DUF4760 domain-containing protein [Pseudomonas mandelii]|uniref:DUF4760 domain-containing protein n=1 Tax=Pseudomonas mandelii TaxID=75612 RepID=UPI00224B73E2|nr:DUF4760 domain-containing protein [Pseudomonas mandelii]MCX2901532.1 DUF4760 domain-containing protein [Pseudomonas mandelii]